MPDSISVPVPPDVQAAYQSANERLAQKALYIPTPDEIAALKAQTEYQEGQDRAAQDRAAQSALYVPTPDEIAAVNADAKRQQAVAQAQRNKEAEKALYVPTAAEIAAAYQEAGQLDPAVAKVANIDNFAVDQMGKTESAMSGYARAYPHMDTPAASTNGGHSWHTTGLPTDILGDPFDPASPGYVAPAPAPPPGPALLSKAGVKRILGADDHEGTFHQGLRALGQQILNAPGDFVNYMGDVIKSGTSDPSMDRPLGRDADVAETRARVAAPSQNAQDRLVGPSSMIGHGVTAAQTGNFGAFLKGVPAGIGRETVQDPIGQISNVLALTGAGEFTLARGGMALLKQADRLAAESSVKANAGDAAGAAQYAQAAQRARDMGQSMNRGSVYIHRTVTGGKAGDAAREYNARLAEKFMPGSDVAKSLRYHADYHRTAAAAIAARRAAIAAERSLKSSIKGAKVVDAKPGAPSTGETATHAPPADAQEAQILDNGNNGRLLNAPPDEVLDTSTRPGTGPEPTGPPEPPRHVDTPVRPDPEPMPISRSTSPGGFTDDLNAQRLATITRGLQELDAQGVADPLAHIEDLETQAMAQIRNAYDAPTGLPNSPVLASSLTSAITHQGAIGELGVYANATLPTMGDPGGVRALADFLNDRTKDVPGHTSFYNNGGQVGALYVGPHTTAFLTALQAAQQEATQHQTATGQSDGSKPAFTVGAAPLTGTAPVTIEAARAAGKKNNGILDIPATIVAVQDAATGGQVSEPGTGAQTTGDAGAAPGGRQADSPSGGAGGTESVPATEATAPGARPGAQAGEQTGESPVGTQTAVRGTEGSAGPGAGTGGAPSTGKTADSVTPRLTDPDLTGVAPNTQAYADVPRGLTADAYNDLSRETRARSEAAFAAARTAPGSVNSPEVIQAKRLGEYWHAFNLHVSGAYQALKAGQPYGVPGDYIVGAPAPVVTPSEAATIAGNLANVADDPDVGDMAHVVAEAVAEAAEAQAQEGNDHATGSDPVRADGNGTVADGPAADGSPTGGEGQAETGGVSGARGGKVGSERPDRLGVRTERSGGNSDTETPVPADRTGNAEAGTVEDGLRPGRRDGGSAPVDAGPIREEVAEHVDDPTQHYEGHVLTDYQVTADDAIGVGGYQRKRQDLLRALRLLIKIESEERLATPEEQKVLVKFPGWGWTGNNLHRSKDNEDDPGLLNDLLPLLTPREIEQARRSAVNSHYTTPTIIEAMWDYLRASGFKGGKVLEPSAGIGLFLAKMPEDMHADSKVRAVELDGLTARILRQLQQKSYVDNSDFAKSDLANNFYDVVVGNVPFGDYPVRDKKMDALGLPNDFQARIHNYFLVKSLRATRPGGVLALISTHGSLDSGGTAVTVRQYLAEEANLLGAIRLPNNAFQGNAATAVTTDILFFQKKRPSSHMAIKERDLITLDGLGFRVQKTDAEGATLSFAGSLTGHNPDIRKAWSELPDYSPGTPDNGETFKEIVNVGTEEEPIKINEYFARHPENVLGTHALTGSQYRANEYTVEPFDGEDLAASLAGTIRALPAAVITPYTRAPRTQIKRNEVEGLEKDARRGRFLAGAIARGPNGEVVVIQPGGDQEIITDKKEKAHLTRYMDVRGALLKVLEDQRADVSDADLAKSQAALKKAYDVYEKAHGKLGGPAKRAWLDDPDAQNVLALEHWESSREATTDGSKPKRIRVFVGLSDQFTKRTQRPNLRPDKADDARAALLISLMETGGLDLPRMEILTGRTTESLLAELTGVVFHHPEGGYQLAAEYGSGNVRQKLADAELAAARDPKYKPNVDFLESVQPEALPPSRIGMKLGAPWIPIDVYQEFLKFITDTTHDVPFSLAQSSESFKWDITGYPSNSTAATSTYGTGDAPAQVLMELSMNGKSPRIYTGKGKDRAFSQELTDQAMAKQQKIRDSFKKWILADSERAERLANLYNQKVNVVARRRYDGVAVYAARDAEGKIILRKGKDGKPNPDTPQFDFQGMNPMIALRLHQVNAVWRVVQQANTLLAHEVGTGKTFTMVTSAMELRRLGVRNKPAIVVKPRTLPQIAGDFMKLYPGAKILVGDAKTVDGADKRQRFMARAATGDWDCVIMSHDCLRLLPVNAFLIQKHYDELISQQREFMENAIDAEGRDAFNVKEAEKAIARLETNLEKEMEKLESADKDSSMFFEEMGIDHLFVDEAQKYKNMTVISNRGVGRVGAPHATDFFIKMRHVQDQGGGVTFATGTPITNSIAEIHTLMKCLAADWLKEHNIEHFDAFAAQYADMITKLERTMDLGYKEYNRLGTFSNVPELMDLYTSFADTVLADDVPGLIRPRMTDEDGNVTDKPIIVESKPNAHQRAYFRDARRRTKAVPKPPVPGEDTVISIGGDVRMASLDVRLKWKDAPDYEDSKINQVVRNTFNNWNDPTHKENKRTQLIFLDQGIDYLYPDMKQKLVKMGVPASEVAFISDFKEDELDDLFDDVNDGVVRVLIGSREKMGVGVNVQKRILALHQVDPTWRPDQLEQADGRALRQGNDFAEGGVKIYQYVNVGSGDSFMWRTVTKKKSYIRQVTTGDSDMREVDEGGDDDFTEAEIDAIADGNPHMIDWLQAKRDVDLLESLSRSEESDRAALAAQATYMRDTGLPAMKRDVGKMEKARDYIASSTPAEFQLKVSDKVYGPEQRNDGAKALWDAALTVPEWGRGRPVASYRGYTVLAEPDNTTGKKGIRLTLKPQHGFHEDLIVKRDRDAYSKGAYTGLLTILDNLMDGYPLKISNALRKIEDIEKEIPKQLKESRQPFEQKEELEALKEKQKALQILVDEAAVAEHPDDGGVTFTPDAYVPTKAELKRRRDAEAAAAPIVMPEDPSKHFFIVDGSGNWRPVKGFAVQFPAEYRTFEAFSYKGLRDWSVVFAKSGQPFASGKTRAKAEAMAVAYLEDFGLDGMEQADEANVERGGLSPRFGGVPVTRAEGEAAPEAVQIKNPAGDFYILRNGDFEDVPAKPLTIPEFPDLEFFSHKSPNDKTGKTWNVSEASTGLAMPRTDAKTEKAARDMALDVAKGMDDGGRERLHAAIESNRARKESPRVKEQAARPQASRAPSATVSGSAENSSSYRPGSTLNAMPDPKVGLFVNEDVLPELQKGAKLLSGMRDDLWHALSPASAADTAGEMARMGREYGAAEAQSMEQAMEALTGDALVSARVRRAKEAWDAKGSLMEKAHAALLGLRTPLERLSRDERLDFIHAIETGQPMPTPELQEIADTIRGLLDDAGYQVQALGTGKLSQMLANYFPHLYKDRKDAESYYARYYGDASLQSSPSFLKERKYDTLRDAMAAGLEPISDDPIEFVLAKLNQMHRYLMAQRWLLAMKKKKTLTRFVAADSQAQAPATWEPLAGTEVWGGNSVDVQEGFDAQVMDKLEKLLTSLGGTHDRQANTRGGQWGSTKAGAVTTKFAGPESVLAHELGHFLDDKYGLWDWLTTPRLRVPGVQRARKTIQSELRDLADLRFEGMQVSPSYRGYVRQKGEKVANAILAMIYAPEKFAAVAPTVKKRLERFIRDRKELHPLRDIRPSLVQGTRTQAIPLGGLKLVGRYYAPHDVARIYNNYLSPGLRGKAWFDGMRWIGNAMNQMQLGLSGFHFTFVCLDAVTSQLALAMQQGGVGLENVIRGALSGDANTQQVGARQLAATPRQALRTLYAPFSYAMAGRRFHKEYYTPGSTDALMAEIVDAAIAGGFRAKMDRIYTNESGKSLKAAAVRVQDALLSGNLLGTFTRAGVLGLKTIPAVVEAFAHPLMEVWVPLMKAGALEAMLRAELEAMPVGTQVSRDDLRRMAAAAVDSIDNRLGQMAYDNLFWDKTLKDALMVGFRSVGWNVGDIRELGGAVFDVATTFQRIAAPPAPPILPPPPAGGGPPPGGGGGGDWSGAGGRRGPIVTARMGYALALAISAGVLGGVICYIRTGRAPKSATDAYFPPTGATLPNGKPERIALPNYAKDVRAYGTDFFGTLGHKAHPLISAALDIRTNSDYYGTQIYDPINKPSEVPRAAGEIAKFLGTQFVPFGVMNATKLEGGLTAGKVLAGFFGAAPAPRDLDYTNAEKLMLRYLGENMPGTRTLDQADQAQTRRTLRERQRAGEDIRGDLHTMVHDGTMTPRSAHMLIRADQLEWRVNTFKRLHGDQALRVYEAATPEERKVFGPLLRVKEKGQGRAFRSKAIQALRGIFPD